jgi:hypothetical protein
VKPTEAEEFFFLNSTPPTLRPASFPMQKRPSSLLACSLLAALLTPALASAQAIFSAAGANAASIQPTVDAFRTALGTLNANNGAAQTSGRREINWDGVPDSASAPVLFPGNFFGEAFTGANGARARGALITTPAGLINSANVPGPNQANALFKDLITAGSGVVFNTFSGDQIFAPFGSTQTTVRFSVPGAAIQPATITGFGAVFLDVNTATSSSLSFFATDGSLLGSFNAAASGHGGFSFLGVNFTNGELIGSVVIQTGTEALAFGTSSGLGTESSGDVVALDDFFYSEPIARQITAVPEPSTYGLFAAALLGGTVWFRRRLAKAAALA